MVSPIIPDVGVDLPGFITAALSAGGFIVAAAVGCWLSLWLIRCGLRWMCCADPSVSDPADTTDELVRQQIEYFERNQIAEFIDDMKRHL